MILLKNNIILFLIKSKDQREEINGKTLTFCIKTKHFSSFFFFLCLFLPSISHVNDV